MIVDNTPPPLEDMTKVIEKLHLDTGQQPSGNFKIYDLHNELV